MSLVYHGRTKMITDYIENVMWRITPTEREVLAQIGDGRKDEAPLAKIQRLITSGIRGDHHPHPVPAERLGEHDYGMADHRRRAVVSNSRAKSSSPSSRPPGSAILYLRPTGGGPG
jgi:hypothetical protein